MDKPQNLQQFTELFNKSEKFRDAVFTAFAYAEKERERHRLKSLRQRLRKKAAEAEQPPKPAKKRGRPRKNITTPSGEVADRVEEN